MSEYEHPAGAPIVVTGCGRSGTSYAAAVLAAVGLDVGHEVVFGPETSAFTGFGARDGDASWLAVPHVASLPADTVVVHQVRHPEDVVRSFLGIRFFADVSAVRLAGDAAFASAKHTTRRTLASLGLRAQVGPPARPHRNFVAFLDRHLPEVWQPQGAVDRALTYWVGWNELLEDTGRVTLRQRVEDMDATGWGRVLDAAGRPVDRVRVQQALREVGGGVNSRRRDESFALGAGSRLADRALALARRYGYDI